MVRDCVSRNRRYRKRSGDGVRMRGGECCVVFDV